MADEPDLITAGEAVKPKITQRQLELLALELYAFRILESQSLGSYDDLNYHIKVKFDDVLPDNAKEPIYVNPYIDEINEDGYVLKIVNTHASARPLTYDMQTKAMFYLSDHEMTCPQPVKSMEGNYYQLRTVHAEDDNGNRLSDEDEGKIHLVCLLTYAPGEVLLKHPNLKVDVFYEAGVFAGKVTATLRNFEHEHFTDAPGRIIWDLRNASYVRQYLFATTNPNRRKLISDVLDAFEKNVIPNFHKFKKGVIHGDLNEQNILYQIVEDKPVINTIIDFGDMTKSYMIFDLAVLMMHLMCIDQGGQFLWTGGEVLRGFRTQVAFTNLELNLLRYMVMMRYATYLAMNQYNLKTDPSNAFYVSQLAARAWPQLEQMWQTSPGVVAQAWHLES